MLTLALGIGANTTVFRIVNGVLLRPLPFEDPESLVWIHEQHPANGWNEYSVGGANFLDWKAQAAMCEDMGVWMGGRFNLTDLEVPEQISGVNVSPNLLPMLGVRTIKGRLFQEAGETENRAEEVLISEGLWKRRYGGDSGILNKSISVNGHAHRIIGVLPHGLLFPEPQTELWAPMSISAYHRSHRAAKGFGAIGRLKPGVELSQARAEFKTVARRLETLYPDTNQGWSVDLIPLHEKLVRHARPLLWILQGAVVLVLLIACANVANLIMTRTIERRKEFAVRTALGASRGAVFRQWTIECLLLALVGDLTGWFVSWQASALMSILVPFDSPRANVPMFDLPVLGFTLAVAGLSGIFLGLVPMVQVSKLNINQTLNEEGRSTARGQQRNRTQSALMIGQVAVTLTLLVGAGLMIRTMWTLSRVEPGFRTQNILTLSLPLASEKYATSQQRAALATRLLDRIRSILKRKGHGRRGAKDYPGARRVKVIHSKLHRGDLCPKCFKAKLYLFKKPARILRMIAQPIFQATIFELERLRCALCGALFTAPPPPEAGHSKYDPSVGVMLALTRYGIGLPMYRTDKWQSHFGVPLPASTQWKLIDAASPTPQALYEGLIDVAAGGSIIHTDDTMMRVQSLRREISRKQDQRTGIFTTGILSRVGEHQIALFFTGQKHAGENLDRLLKNRAAGLAKPLHMCDGLSRNHSKEFETILCNCLCHGRRNFLDVVDNFPQECRKIIESLAEVYRVDALAKEQQFSDTQRLILHQTQSKSVMDELHQWMQEQMEHKKVEPNSGLGQAISYMLKRWEPLTRFLSVPSAPLDNNLCERALKMAILHRKNSLSFKTLRGAQVGDVFMSLIHTCQLNGVNPFDYLMALQQHTDCVRKALTEWFPWNLLKTLKKLHAG